MLIVCPQCAASYEVAPAALGMDGRSVRCAACHTIWFAAPREPALEDAAAGPVMAAPDLPEAAASFGGEPEPGPAVTAEPAEDMMTSANVAAEVDTVPQIPEVMDESPSIVPPLDEAAAPPGGPAIADPEPAEEAAPRRMRNTRPQPARGRARLKIPGLPTLLFGLLAVVAVLILARGQVVKYLPQTASFYEAIGLPVNLRGLDFEDIRVTRESQDGVAVLVVEGKIVSSKGIAEVPRLRFAIHDGAGKEIYTWTMMPSRSLLAPGESLPFRSRLASPPAEGQDVSIRFFNRRDAMSGFR